MTKRHFLKSLAALAVTASVAGAQAADAPSPPVRRRRDRSTRNGVFIPATIDHTPDEWKRVFERMRVAGVDGILAQVYDGEHAYWDSARLPVQTDRLKTFLPLAAEAGLEVHAWMATLPCRVAAVREAHLDWYTRDANGTVSDAFLEPDHPDVRAFVCGIVKEIATVPGVNGVHLAEARYPSPAFGYGEHLLAPFVRTHGADPRRTEDGTVQAAWTERRRDALNVLVNEHLAPAAHEHAKAITASVLPLAVARTTALQDWPRWKLNAFFPLLFHDTPGTDLAWITREAQAAVAAVDVPVCVGLQAGAFDLSGMAKAVRAALEGGASGVALHALDTLTEERWMGMQLVIIGQRPD
jgi:uncharacterized lipoprotein YddW (UPF0748 family)